MTLKYNLVVLLHLLQVIITYIVYSAYICYDTFSTTDSQNVDYPSPLFLAVVLLVSSIAGRTGGGINFLIVLEPSI